MRGKAVAGQGGVALSVAPFRDWPHGGNSLLALAPQCLAVWLWLKLGPVGTDRCGQPSRRLIAARVAWRVGAARAVRRPGCSNSPSPRRGCHAPASSIQPPHKGRNTCVVWGLVFRNACGYRMHDARLQDEVPSLPAWNLMHVLYALVVPLPSQPPHIGARCSHVRGQSRPPFGASRQTLVCSSSEKRDPVPLFFLHGPRALLCSNPSWTSAPLHVCGGSLGLPVMPFGLVLVSVGASFVGRAPPLQHGIEL